MISIYSVRDNTSRKEKQEKDTYCIYAFLFLFYSFKRYVDKYKQ